MQNKIKSLEKLVKHIHNKKKNQKTVGLITGCFDIIHPGHVHFIQEAKSHCDILILGVENDENIARVKGTGRPIHTFEERALILSEMKSVTYLFKIDQIFKHYTPESDDYYHKLIQDINPTFYMLNPDTDAYWEKKKDQATSLGINIVNIKRKYQQSTSEIAHKIAQEI